MVRFICLFGRGCWASLCRLFNGCCSCYLSCGACSLGCVAMEVFWFRSVGVKCASCVCAYCCVLCWLSVVLLCLCLKQGPY